VSGRHTFRKLRVKIERDPERRGLMGEKRKAYDVLLNLAELREAKGLTQAELAERLGVSQPNVSKLEAAAASPHAGPSTFDPQRVHCRPGQSPRGVGLLPRAPRGRRRRRRGLGNPIPGVGAAEISDRGCLLSFLSGLRTAQP
jgi:DNA-binding XRE family transcriptional regulator